MGALLHQCCTNALVSVCFTKALVSVCGLMRVHMHNCLALCPLHECECDQMAPVHMRALPHA